DAGKRRRGDRQSRFDLLASRAPRASALPDRQGGDRRADPLPRPRSRAGRDQGDLRRARKRQDSAPAPMVYAGRRGGDRLRAMFEGTADARRRGGPGPVPRFRRCAAGDGARIFRRRGLALTMAEPRNVWNVGAELGEGPVWVERDRALWFTDIKTQKVHRYDPATGDRKSWDSPEQVGFALPAEGGGF